MSTLFSPVDLKAHLRLYLIRAKRYQEALFFFFFCATFLASNIKLTDVATIWWTQQSLWQPKTGICPSGAGGNQNGAEIKVTFGPTFVSLAQTGLSKCLWYRRNPMDSNVAAGHGNTAPGDKTMGSMVEVDLAIGSAFNLIDNICGVMNVVNLWAAFCPFA